MDVAYNHTSATGNNFERTVSGYIYRQKPGRTLVNPSACGNETASERPMMRKFMVESVLHRVNEYHIDGFHFDLIGIHDIGMMNEICLAVSRINSSIIFYGVGWAASQPSLNNDLLAMNASGLSATVNVPEGKYTVVCQDGVIAPNGMRELDGGEVSVSAQSVLIIYK